MTRDELVVVLYSWQDFVPLPPTWTGALQRRSAILGPAPFVEKVRCRTCDGRGRLPNKRVCHECKGKGQWNYDPYVGRMFGGERWADLPEPPARFRDREKTGDRVLDALAVQHDRRDGHYCYQAITAAAAELAPGVRGVIVITYILQAQHPNEHSERCVDQLHAQLRESLRPPRWLEALEDRRLEVLVRARGRAADPRARRARDEEIRRRRREGAKLAELEQEFGLDKGQLSRITRAA